MDIRWALPASPLGGFPVKPDHPSVETKYPSIMSTTVDQSSQSPFPAAQGDHQPHSTAQAHEQGPHPGTPPSEHPHDLKSRPNDAHNEHHAPTPKAAKQSPDSASASASDGSESSGAQYPPQKHAGKAGLGPHYYEKHRATLHDKIHGLKEEVEGRIKHDDKLRQVRPLGTGLEAVHCINSLFLAVQQGHDRITGEHKEKQREKVSRVFVVSALWFFLSHLFL